MADEKYVEYVDIQPAPDSEITVSTGPMVPADEADKALGENETSDEDNDDSSDEK